MSKNYKKKNKQAEITTEVKELSKKEEYDLNKKKKEETKKKLDSKKKKHSKNSKKHHQTNLGTRIFAIAMLLLMILSVIASAGAYLVG